MYAYESVDHPGNFLIMSTQGSFSVGDPIGNIHEFTLNEATAEHITLSADVGGSTCYMAFGLQGYQVANPCALSTNELEQAKLRYV